MSPGTRLDPWADAYARRAHGMTASAIRALFAVANRPEVVSLAGGMPNLSALPMDAVAEVAHEIVATQGAQALQYGSGQGDPELRARITEVMALEGIQASADDVVVTTGSQQALDLVARIFLDPGDIVLAEAPSYVGALSVFHSFQAEIRHVSMDAHGLDVDALEAELQRLAAHGRTPKLLYTIPNHHNPGGVTLSIERRSRILEIAQRYGVLVLEDNPYGLLGFDHEPLPALRSMDAEGVVYLGSFSKTFSPGLRVGWALAPPGIRDKLVLASEASILCPSSFAQLAVTGYLTRFDWRGQIKAFREQYRERRDAMLRALSDFLPNATWTVPDGGFYVWVGLPEGLDAAAMLPRAVTERVAYTPGTAFFSDGQGSQHMRLSYCYPTPERIREGVRRLAVVVGREIELVETFGSSGAQAAGPGWAEGSAPGPDRY